MSKDAPRHDNFGMVPWVTKVLCGVLLIALAGLGIINRWQPIVSFPAIYAQGVVILGAGITLCHYRFIKSHSASLQTPSRLCRSGGLFQWIRHPMYLGDLIWYLGFVLLFPSSVSFAVYLIAVIAICLLIKREETQLKLQFEDDYCEWLHSSNKLLPLIY